MHDVVDISQDRNLTESFQVVEKKIFHHSDDVVKLCYIAFKLFQIFKKRKQKKKKKEYDKEVDCRQKYYIIEWKHQTL